MKFNVRMALFVVAIFAIGADCDTDKPREKRTIHLFLQQFIDAFGTKPQPKVAKTTEPTGFKFNFFVRPLAKLSQTPTEDPKEFVPMPFPPSIPIQNGPSKVNLPFMQTFQMTPSAVPVMPPTMAPTTMPPTTMPPTMPPTTMPPTMPPTTMPPTMPPTTMVPTMPPTMMPPTMPPMPAKMPSMSMMVPAMQPMSMMVPAMQPMSPMEMNPVTMPPMIESKVFTVDMATDATPKMPPQMGATSQPIMSFAQNANVDFGGNFNNVGQQYNQYESDYPQYWGNNYYQPETYQSFPYYQSNDDSDYNNNFADPTKANAYLPPYQNQQQPMYQQSQQSVPQEPQYKAPRVVNAQKKDGSSHSSVKMHGSDFNYFTYHHDSDYGQDYSALGQQPSYQFYGKRSVN